MMALYALGFNDSQSEGTIAPPPMRKQVTEADFNDTQQSEETITLPPIKKWVTEEEYWEKYYHFPDVVFEWNNGYLEEKPVSDFATYSTYQWFGDLLGYYSTTKPIAKITGLDMGFRLVLPQKTKVRRPDLAIVLNSNPVALKPEDNSYKGTFDLCVEAVSTSSKKHIKRDTDVKKGEYVAGGVKEYYILDGYDRYTQFYRLNAQGIYTPILATEGIIKSMVLPGFQFRIKDLYCRPTPDKMIDDPIYQGFVLPGYSQAKQQAEEATQRADKAEQRAERFAEQLRALGINPDDILTK